MPTEILSTARPSPLRLAGFLCTVLGGLALGLGALSTWATVGFPQDTEGAADVVYKGVDTWGGILVLLASLVVLLGTVVVRLLTTTRARRIVTVAILVLSLVALAAVCSAALRPEARFGGSGGLDRIATDVAQQLDLPVDEVRSQLEQQFGRQLSVDLGPGVWLSAAGAVLAAVGAGLTLVWISRSAVAGRVAADEVSPEGPPDA